MTALKSTFRVSLSPCSTIIHATCCKKLKQGRLQRKAIDRVESKLDVLKIVKLQSDVTILLRSLLTKRQQTLVHYQREHIISTSDENDKALSDQGVSNYYTAAFYKDLTSQLLNFRVQSRFEKELLNGIIDKGSSEKSSESPAKTHTYQS